jgi:hypothetical protein
MLAHRINLVLLLLCYDCLERLVVDEVVISYYSSLISRDASDQGLITIDQTQVV